MAIQTADGVKIRLGISMCPLGENVRYDGGTSSTGSSLARWASASSGFQFARRWSAGCPLLVSPCASWVGPTRRGL